MYWIHGDMVFTAKIRKIFIAVVSKGLANQAAKAKSKSGESQPTQISESGMSTRYVF